MASRAGVAYEAEIGPLPATRTHTTPSGGQHKLFRAPASANIGMAKRGLAAYPGLDIVGKGGLVPFPPSRRVGMPGKKDGAYRVLDNSPIAELPPALVALLTRPPRPESAAPGCGDPEDPAVQARAAAIARRCLETLAAARPGERNTMLNTVAFALGQIERFERDHQATLRQVVAIAKRLGLGDDEITRTVASGRTAGRAEPRDFSDTGLFPNAAATLRWAAARPLAGTPAETALLNLVPGLIESPPCLRFEPADGVYGDGLLVSHRTEPEILRWLRNGEPAVKFQHCRWLLGVRPDRASQTASAFDTQSTPDSYDRLGRHQRGAACAGDRRYWRRLGAAARSPALLHRAGHHLGQTERRRRR